MNPEINLLTTKDVCARLGGIGRTTLHLWRNDPALRFPAPVKINRRTFWRPTDLDRWTATRIARSAKS